MKQIINTLLFALINGLLLAQVPVDIAYLDEKSDFPIDYPLYRIQESGTNKMGFIDRKGRELIPCQFDFAQSFKGDSAFVRDNKTQKWGIINKWGTLVMPYQFDEPFDWNNDCFKYAFVEKHQDCILKKKILALRV
jgi:WG containing repeat